ncbi:hypothetical protein LINPERPRIM_LOCUS4633 [Linum perenne]
MGSTSILLLTLFILTSASFAAANNDTTKFEVVKEAACSKDKGGDWYSAAASILMGKLVDNTLKNVSKDGDGYNYATTVTMMDAKTEGEASCEKGDDKDECRACLVIAMTHLTTKCGNKEAGGVELKGCKMSFQKKN